MDFIRPEHEIIAKVLAAMDSAFLMECECWFGGGTAIVLNNGEYRRSLDLDFLCASRDGYRKLREGFFDHGIRALFPEPVEKLRDVRADASGIRMMIGLEGQPIKFEIVNEPRIDLHGAYDPNLQIPTLSAESMFAEKLLANADRCQDRAVSYRDAIDLGRLVLAYGSIPPRAVEAAEEAYGKDVARFMVWVLNHLQDTSHVRFAAEALDMDFEAANESIITLRHAALEVWPDKGINPDEPVQGDGYGY